MRQLVALVRVEKIRPFRYVVDDPANLWGGSVLKLGTKKHRDKYFKGIDNVDYPGCCAMTELHHVSNVQGLQTTATFDPVTDEFILDTPNDGAIKWWIGNASVHVSDKGVHAFIVPIRDLKTHQTLPGIEIQDCGHKIGLNGVDNGALRFRSVRFPRDNLLNRFGDVSRDGKYTSSLPTINKRFAAMLGELVGGRVGLAYSSVGFLKISVTIAVWYSLLRQQFSPPKQPEVSILDYQSQQHKLMPMLASSYAFHFAAQNLVEKYAEMKKTHDEQLVADVHALSAGLKSYVTSIGSCGSIEAIQRQVPRCTDHLRDPKFQLDAFRYRTSRLLQSVAARLQKHSKTLGNFGAWNRCLNHLLTLAESHIESVILARFIEAVQKCPNASSRAALKLVCDLYALDRIWNDIGTYRNVDYVAPNKAKLDPRIGREQWHRSHQTPSTLLGHNSTTKFPFDQLQRLPKKSKRDTEASKSHSPFLAPTCLDPYYSLVDKVSFDVGSRPHW
ncbi:Acyl-coenzyme A oxidase, peroxisomal [Hibiscus syriacus]|uniref:acyl-CoA oxidase n=1 Tax=Hibiscus syriacus TaxID=106335 RepID=A0A6A2YMZ0_HIBSY|nr:Acyl-coenzyme A oxidase, peroxisomal [Hibiscus syriacus]